jgi:hypothetical protein
MVAVETIRNLFGHERRCLGMFAKTVELMGKLIRFQGGDEQKQAESMTANMRIIQLDEEGSEESEW